MGDYGMVDATPAVLTTAFLAPIHYNIPSLPRFLFSISPSINLSIHLSIVEFAFPSLHPFTT